MYIKKTLSFIFILILLFQSFFFVKVSATENNVDSIISDLNNEIGSENTTSMFEDLKEKILTLNDISKEEILEIINYTSEKYGVVFTEEQLDILVNYYEKLLEDENGILDSIINLFQNFWDWLKSLHSESKVEVEPNIDGNKPLVESEDDTVTINIPTVEEVDGIMDKIIEKIKLYVFPEE